MKNEGAGGYGDFDPTTFRIPEQSEDGESHATAEQELLADHDIEQSPEKTEGKVERRVLPGEYLAALERVLAGSERDALKDKLGEIMKKLDKLDPDKKAGIIEVLGDTFRELKRASKGLEDYYESAGLMLDEIGEALESK